MYYLLFYKEGSLLLPLAFHISYISFSGYLLTLTSSHLSISVSFKLRTYFVLLETVDTTMSTNKTTDTQTITTNGKAISNTFTDPSEDASSTLKPGRSSPPQKPSRAAGGAATTNSGPLVVVQPPQRGDLQPSYAQQIQHDDTNPSNNGWYAKMKDTLGRMIGTAGAIPGLFCFPNPYKEVKQGQVGLVMKFGRFERAVDPGLVKINPLSESLVKVDVRIQIVGTCPRSRCLRFMALPAIDWCFASIIMMITTTTTMLTMFYHVEVPLQVCMTKDNVTLQLRSVIYYHITSPHKAYFGISDVRTALVERTQTTLRHVIGARVLQDVVERREEIAQSIREIIEGTATGWGVQVESMLIKDIIFSQDLQDSLSMAAQSKRKGEAKIIVARAEVESAKLMRQAADILSSEPAMQIRYLEAMQAMARTSNSKVIFLPASAGPAGGISTQSQQGQQGQSGVNQAEAVGEGPSSYGLVTGEPSASSASHTNGRNGMQSAVNATVTEGM